jgi:hypothetical protein
MNRCSKCNNELVADARFCNICGTPAPKAPTTPTGGLKRTIHPDIRRVRPLREGQIPKTTIEFTSVKAGQAAEKQKAGSPGGAPKTAAPTKEIADAVTSALPDSTASAPAKTLLPTPANDAPVKTTPPSTVEETPAKTSPLPAPDSAPAKTSPLPAPTPGAGRVPGIIRPIVTTASLRQNAPPAPGQAPLSPSSPPPAPNPVSPPPAVPNTPALPRAQTPPADNIKFPRPVYTPVPNSLAQDNQRLAERPKQGPVVPRPSMPTPPNGKNNAGWQQAQRATPNAGVPLTPLSSLHDMPTNYLELHNGNGANGAADREDYPLFSPESFAYTSKAAEHWRNSWRDLQNAEAGPADDVSKGQASVPAPLAARQNSFIRMRAIKQKQDASEKNFGFWVTLFLMICLIGGLGAYIVYSYLPGLSLGAAHITQPNGAQQPSLTVAGTSSQTFTSGQSLRAHGEHFGANDSIHFLLDSTTPILTSGGRELSVQADNQGAFDVTIAVGKSWAPGTHIIQALDTQTNQSAYLDIEVNPGGTPVSNGNSTDLTFTLNGQTIKQLSFTAQIGQLAPPTQRITFTNTSGAVMQWTAVASTDHNLSWLTIVDGDFAGQLDIQQPHSMGISVNPAGLPVTPTGKPAYRGQIIFTINGNRQLTLPVQLTIIDATPEMVFSPNPLVATAKSDGTCGSDVTLTFINLGTVVINWSANPDLQNNIQFINGANVVTERGLLQPSGMDGDTQVVTLRCSGVKAGDKYHVAVYANSTQFSEIVLIE